MADRVDAECAAERTAGRVDAGRLLLGGYALFVVAAGSRSAVQLATHAGRAPLAYSLSAVAAGVYLVGFALLARRSSLAAAWCLLELAGVILVGLASVVRPAWFPDATVWSRFGEGYGFVPLILPLLALAWLRRRHPDVSGLPHTPGSRAPSSRNPGGTPGYVQCAESEGSSVITHR